RARPEPHLLPYTTLFRSHDSCYLARHNDVRMEPRELVAAVGEPVEMKRSGKQTFCCGAGGAHMWMEERGRGINEERVREAAETGDRKSTRLNSSHVSISY